MSVNKVILVGRLGKDPELRFTPSQTPVCSFPLATSERRKNAEGEWAEQTEWHSVVVWGKQGENCSQFLQKGREVFIEGRIQTRKWQDQQGNDRYRTEVIANNVQFLGGRGDGPTLEKTFTSDENASSGMSASMAPQSSGGGVSFEDDDIPF